MFEQFGFCYKNIRKIYHEKYCSNIVKNFETFQFSGHLCVKFTPIFLEILFAIPGMKIDVFQHLSEQYFSGCNLKN